MIHRDGTVGGEAQGVVTIAPVFDEGDVWVGDTCYGWISHFI